MRPGIVLGEGVQAVKTFPSSNLPQLLMDSLHRRDFHVFVRPEHMAFSFLRDEAKHMEVT